MAEGAFVNVYAAAPMCAEAQEALDREQGRAGDVRVRLVCLQRTEAGGRIDLGEVGSNARSAAEDSAAVAYLATPDEARNRFLSPILESANIPLLTSPSGASSMTKLLRAIEQADEAGSLREAVSNKLDDDEAFAG